MLTLSVRIRQETGKKLKLLRKKGLLPAVLYGPKIKPMNLEVDLEEFKKTFQQAGESSLVSLEVSKGEKSLGKYLALIHETDRDATTDEIIHVDFYQPELEKEIEIKVPLVWVGQSPAVKNLGGTLVKNIQEVKVRALPQDFPKEIEVDISSLETLKSHIFIKDLKVSQKVKILDNPDEIIASVAETEKVEEELAKPVEEKVEEVKVIEKEKKKEEAEEKEKMVEQIQDKTQTPKT